MKNHLSTRGLVSSVIRFVTYNIKDLIQILTNSRMPLDVDLETPSLMSVRQYFENISMMFLNNHGVFLISPEGAFCISFCFSINTHPVKYLSSKVL